MANPVKPGTVVKIRFAEYRNYLVFEITVAIDGMDWAEWKKL